MSNKVAVIKTGGKQYKVKEGEVLKVEKLGSSEGKDVKFNTLLVASEDGKEFEVGKPELGERVEAKVLEHGKNKKVSVVKYKNKTRYNKNVGHRQMFTKVQVTKIS